MMRGLKHVSLLGNIVLFCCILNAGYSYVEGTRIIHINKDGSGYIYIRMLYNPKELEEGQKILDLKKLQAANYGEGVRFVIAKEITGTNGWKGYLAKYHFGDVSKLRIFPQSLPRAMTAADDDEIKLSGWRFQLRRRDPIVPEVPKKENQLIKKLKQKVLAKEEKKEEPKPIYFLNIIPLADDLAVEDEPPPEEENNQPEPAKAEAKENFAMKMLQVGHRFVTYIEIDGHIDRKRSNVKYISEKFPNIFVLNDEQYEIMWNDPQMRAEILREEPNFSGYEDRPGYRTIYKKSTVVFQ
ncbi:MAG: hypothetical protein D6820_04485 [Lentisphaerae bacterium]|nr:MAG: hypothetical protein D6820_04485 [Lentisphaerota bacterium]